MKIYGIVYKAVNLCYNKSYVGKTTQPLNERKLAHKRNTKRIDKFKKISFYNAIRKYGFENFRWEVLKECDSKEMLGLMETFMIMVHHSHWTENGYNMTWGGDGGEKGNHFNKGIKHTDEWKKLMSEKFSGAGHPLFGKHHSESSKNKMSLAKIGKKHSEETKIKQSESHIGLIKTETHKLNLSKSLKGKPKSVEHCKKISEAKKGSIPWNKGMKFKKEENNV
jgi:group I intron endonuclease